MNQLAGVQLDQSVAQGDADAQDLVDRKWAARGQFPAKCPGGVAVRVNGLRSLHVIGRFHDIVEVVPCPAAARMQDADEARVIPRDRLKSPQPGKLSIKWAIFAKGFAVDHFNGAITARETLSQPYLAIAASANHAQKLILADFGEFTVTGSLSNHNCTPCGSWKAES